LSKKGSTRYLFPLLAGKVARVATRLRGGGSAFPGYIVNRMAPSFLPSVAHQFRYGVIFVLGSNGKTTTTHMISEVLRAHGLRVFTNPSGANLPQGITSALLAETDLLGRVASDIAVLEVDEAFASELSEILSPSTVVALNVQVDQLYRFFETERVADMMLDAAQLATKHVIVNSDDPYLSTFDRSSTIADVSWFGASAALVAASAHGLSNAPDYRSDPSASAVRAMNAEVSELAGRSATILLDEQPITVTLPAKGLHYAVDAAAAMATVSRVLGTACDPAAIATGFLAMVPAYGRGELLPLGADTVEFVMFKNAPSLQLNLDALDAPPEQVILAIDEGTPDISWIYDVDFDALDHVDVVSGEKAFQLALRLEHESIPMGAILPDLAAAVDVMRAMPVTKAGRKTWILNYELMMIGRKLLGHGDQEVARK
jgi:UDP-N-acetylmuramyl tripeptide synthase